MIDNRVVGRTIATLRQNKGMTQQQLAAAMNVSHQAVSKWENGAALPDVQTLVGLSQLFGLTLEQLLEGNIPEERLDTKPALDERIQHIGNFVNGVIDDIGNMFKSEPKEVPPEKDGAVEAEVVDEAAPEQDIDIQNLLQMAPFMSKGAVEDMLRNCKRKLNAAEIARFAPFVDSDCLERLILNSESEITWDTLRRIAPFLKKEAVDALARTVANGEKLVSPLVKDISVKSEDVCKTIDDVSKKVGKVADKAIKKAVKLGENVVSEVTKALDELGMDSESRDERSKRLRRSVFERALADEKWDWIEAHIAELDELNAEALKQKISERATELGMKEWVVKNLGFYADEETIREAIDNGDWGWLGEHASKLNAKLQQSIALAAMKAENWQWLSTYSEQIDLSDSTPEIVTAALNAGARVLAVQLTRCNASESQVKEIIAEAFRMHDHEFIDMLIDIVAQESLDVNCEEGAKQADWEAVKHYADKLSDRCVEKLMELAIEQGNFDAIDMLNTYL